MTFSLSRSRLARASAVLLTLALAACGGDKASPSGATSGTMGSAPPATSSPPPVATEAPSASATASAVEDAGAPPPVKAADHDPANKAKPPSDSEELQSRARGLFDAVVQNNASLGEDMWFPREPFLILKDIKEPGKYWDQLHRAFIKDVEKLHKKRPSWEGATFEKFEPGSPPKWVKPGDEGNKIGYYRTVKGNLVYKADGKSHKLEVRVMISWQNRWYITHLGKFK